MNEYKSEARKDLIISALCFVLGIIVGIVDGSISSGSPSELILTALVCGAIGGGVRYGWRALSFITPRVFIIMPIIGWVIYFLIKLVVSLFIAPFLFIIKTILNIIALAKK